MSRYLELHLGVLADKISKQLDKQGFSFDEKQVERLQGYVDALHKLMFGDLLTDAELGKVFSRLQKKIVKHVQETADKEKANEN